jgi:hypothetical protein
MISTIIEIKSRNEALFYFGLLCLVFATICLILTHFTSTQVYGVNAWFKPLKFSLSTCLFVWSMAWYCHYLPGFKVTGFNITVITMLGFEIAYIAIQASRGQLSHYNQSSPMYAMLFTGMALAATIVTIYTAYIGYLFCALPIPQLPDYYIWSIRLAIIIFVAFSFQGFLMGSLKNHSIGAINDNSSLFIVGWSRKAGDLRIAHFIGMHALQVIPILSYYVFKNTKATILLSSLYLLLAVFTLYQAMQGIPFGKLTSTQHETNEKRKMPNSR